MTDPITQSMIQGAAGAAGGAGEYIDNIFSTYIYSGTGSNRTINNGIDIATNQNTIVRTVFDGTISRIFFIKGAGKAILINHGEYFSVYSGLKEISVKVGEKVLSKEKIGIVITQESDHKTELHFEIWKGYKKQDPSKWLFKAY